MAPMAPMDSAPQIDREINAYGWGLADAAMDCDDLRESAALVREANELRHAFILANPSQPLNSEAFLGRDDVMAEEIAMKLELPLSEEMHDIPQWKDAEHGKQTARITELEHENAELRRQLWQEWRDNHSEHCGEPWPHEGRCGWPLPSLLGGSGGSQ